MNPDLGLAARTLGLDLAAGEVIRALEAAGIDCMVLKGPAMALHLYGDAPGRRNYGDIDVLVPPGGFDAAGHVLASLGFQDQLAGIRASEADRLQGRPWHHRGAADVAVDLHRGFHHVVDRSAWWALLSGRREVVVVEGQPMSVPDRVGCAAIAALHASKASSLGKPLEDLRRALRLFDDEVWRQAAELVRAVGAGDAFAAALCRESAGVQLAGRLGLTVTDPVTWFWATAEQRGAGSLSALLAPGSWTARAQRLRDAAFPSAAVFAGSWPLAVRGRSGLAVARLGRLCTIAVRLPRVLLAWHRTSGTLRRGGPTSGGLAPSRQNRALRVRGRAVLATSWWTVRTWWRIRRGLARGPRRRDASPAPAPASYSARAARLVLACCRPTCLETALVRQVRAAGLGVALDVVVGVTSPAGGFRAHAWLDGDRVEPQFVELCRYPAVGVGPDRRRRAA